MLLQFHDKSHLITPTRLVHELNTFYNTNASILDLKNGRLPAVHMATNYYVTSTSVQYLYIGEGFMDITVLMTRTQAVVKDIHIVSLHTCVIVFEQLSKSRSLDSVVAFPRSVSTA